MDKQMLSPREIGRSAVELFVRSGLWWLWLLTAIVAGAIGIGERFGVKNISNHAWFRVAIIGAIVSLAVAYHRLRLEREAARTGDVRPDHLSDLQGWLAGLINNVGHQEACAYGEPSKPNEASFRAHYSDLDASLTAWDDAVERVGLAAGALDEQMARATAAAGIDDGSVYSPEEVVAVLRRFLVGRIRRDELAEPVTLKWGTEGPYAVLGDKDGEPLLVKLEGTSIATLTVQPRGDWTDDLAAVQPPIEKIFAEARGWGETLDLASAQDELLALRESLLGELEHWRKATGLRVTRACSICRKNEGWGEPRQPFWRRDREPRGT